MIPYWTEQTNNWSWYTESKALLISMYATVTHWLFCIVNVQSFKHSNIFLQVDFYRASSYASAVLAVVILSVRPSKAFCDKTKQCTADKSIKFDCNLDHAKRNFYRAVNEIFAKLGRLASELRRSNFTADMPKCMPILLLWARGLLAV